MRILYFHSLVSVSPVIPRTTVSLQSLTLIPSAPQLYSCSIKPRSHGPIEMVEQYLFLCPLDRPPVPWK